MGYRAIAPDTGIVVEIPRLCHTGNGEKEQVGFGLPHGRDGYLQLGPVNRVACLKSHYPLPTEPLESGFDFFRCQPKLLEIRVKRQTRNLDFSPQIVVTAVFKEISNARMVSIQGVIEL